MLIVGADKTQRRVRELFGALWSICPDANLIVLDQGVDVHNLSEVAWRTLGNVDWRRDILINSGPVDHFAPDGTPPGQVGIDATAKSPADGHPRGWPHGDRDERGRSSGASMRSGASMGYNDRRAMNDPAISRKDRQRPWDRITCPGS